MFTINKNKGVSLSKVEKLYQATVWLGMEQSAIVENGGRNLALLCDQSAKLLKTKSFCLLSGGGNNAAYGLCAARYLHSWGYKIFVIPAEETGRLKPVAFNQISVLRSLKVKFHRIADIKPLAGGKYIIIDALIGCGLIGDAKTAHAKLINAANRAGKFTISCDVPSGLNSDDGRAGSPTIEANATMMLGMIKRGVMSKSAKKFVGKIYLADIGLPSEAYKRAGIKINLRNFIKTSYIRL